MWPLFGSHDFFIWFLNPIREVWLARFEADAAKSLQVKFVQDGII